MTPRFWHAGLTVRDLARSTAFYRDVVGMAEGARMHSANPQFGRLTNNPGATLDAVFMTLDRFTLQLLQYLTRGGAALQLAHNNIGGSHFSFFVDDVAAKYRQLTDGGANVTSEIVTNAAATISSFYVADPDGVPIEFVEQFTAGRLATVRA